MNGKQFIVLLVIVIVIGVAGWMVYQRGNSSWQSGGLTLGGKLLPNLQVNDVAQIDIQSGTNELTMGRSDNLWRVHERGDYPADFSKISDLLTKLADLKMVQSQEVGSSQLGRFDLLPAGTATNSATELVLKDQSGKAMTSLLLGKEHMNQGGAGGAEGGEGGWPDGRYVKTGDGRNVALISDPLDSVQTRPEDWLDKTFFKIENPESVAVAFPIATNSWKLSRPSVTNDWQLADAKAGEKLDSSKLNDVTSPFESPSFDDVSAGATAPADANAVTVETFDGLTYTAKVWSAEDGSYSMTIAASAANSKDKAAQDKLAQEKPFEKWTYQIPSYTVENLLKPRSELLLSETNTVKK